MIHLQAPVPGWLEAVDRLPDGAVVKAVDNVQALPKTFEIARKKALATKRSLLTDWEIRSLTSDEWEELRTQAFFSDEVQRVQTEDRHKLLANLSELKEQNSRLTTVLRHWYDPGQVFGGTYEENKQRARMFFQSFVDGTFRQHAANVDYIEEWNEYLANSQTPEEVASRIMWAQAAAEVWLQEYRQGELAHIRLVLCNTAVGNDIAREFAIAAIEYDAVIGYHPYTQWRNGIRMTGDFANLSGRFVAMEQSWIQGPGYEWLFTEAGPFESAVTGWRAPECLGGDINQYIVAVRDWIRDVKGTAAYREGRIHGFALFTTGGGSRWQWFETKQPELNALADMVASEWTSTPPPPPPPPPPPNGQTRDFEGGWTDLSGRIQQPDGFTVRVWQRGELMPYGGGKTVTGTVEAKHLKCGQQLPQNQCVGGSDPLILSGVTTYKIQAVAMASCTSLKTTFTGTGRKRVMVPINVHYQPPDTYNREPPLETDDVYAVLLLNGREVKRLQFPDLLDRSWLVLDGEADGPVEAELRFQTSYQNSRDMFTDYWTAQEVTDPPPPPHTWTKLVILTPQDTTQAEYDFLQSVALPTKTEIAFSADSAFARPANVTGHRVIVYGAERWGGQQALIDFVRDNYEYTPATQIVWRDFPVSAWPWPVDNALHRVNSAFGVPRDYDGDGDFDDRHEGVDLYAELDDPIRAVMPGRVIWASDKRRSDGKPSAYGKHVIIEHDGELYESWYCHLYQLGAFQGERVEPGYIIGTAGSSGNSTGVHLHFNVRKRGHVAGAGYVLPDVIDPAPLLGV